LERRLVAILAADVVGYTRLMGQDEAGTLARLKRFRGQVFDPLTAKHGGRIVKLMGDGALVEFASVVQAVACAVALQRAAETHEAELPEDRRIRLRIGVNLGDVIVEAGDLYGDGVNIAARLEGLAEPGGICVTAKVRDEVGSRLDIGFEDIGPVEVKNVAEPVQVCRITAAGTARKAPALPDKPSVAVLPFANMSGDPEQDYFSDGITEDIITELSRHRTLFVIARNSSFVYRGQAADLRKVGRELGVRYVLEGSVRRAGNRIRVTAQLVEAETGSHVWAERYDRDMADIFGVQDEITAMIASALSDRVEFAEGERRQRRAAANPTAYDLLLRATNSYFQFTKDSNAEGRRLLLQAIELDPGLAVAHLRLAYTYLIDVELGWHFPPEERVAQARAAAERAVALDPADARAETALAYACLFCADWDGAEIHVRRAVRLNPNDAEAMSMRGYVEACLGDNEGGLTQIEQAQRLNPFAPDYYFWVQGIALYALGRHAEALAALREMRNAPTVTLSNIAACYARLGRMDEARQAMAGFLRRAEAEHARFAGTDAAAWRAYFHHAMPARDPAQLDRWMEGFRMAGLPG